MRMSDVAACSHFLADQLYHQASRPYQSVSISEGKYWSQDIIIFLQIYWAQTDAADLHADAIDDVQPNHFIPVCNV